LRRCGGWNTTGGRCEQQHGSADQRWNHPVLTVPKMGVPVEAGSVERHDFILLVVSFAISSGAETLQRSHDTWSDLRTKNKIAEGLRTRGGT
jgi:hypothetical protein